MMRSGFGMPEARKLQRERRIKQWGYLRGQVHDDEDDDDNGRDGFFCKATYSCVPTRARPLNLGLHFQPQKLCQTHIFSPIC